MSDGPSKPDEEFSLTDCGGKRAGRARICKQCKFTTTDVREFSNHRLHAHAEDNSEENNKTVTRKNSLRRKSSAASEKIVSTEEQKTVASEDCFARGVDALEKSANSENSPKTEQTTVMASEQISPELLSSLALAPRKSVSSEKTKQDTMNKFNGHSDEALMNSRDDERDDEPRLVIADGSDNEADSPDGHVPSRSGNIQNRNYLCGNCDFTSTSAKTYLRHQRDVHNSGIVIYECDICDYATKYKQKLPRHHKLHFNGKEGQSESDIETNLTERELKEMRENVRMNTSMNMELLNGEEDMDDDDREADEEDEEEMVALSSARDGSTPGSTPIEAKKKRIRQEVDPLKYYEVVDEVGVKYACSKCGNVYKWRKSLNKHWKEKHCGETPDLTKPPATLQNYTLYSRYKTKFGGPPPAAPNVVYGAAAASPANQMKANRTTPTSNHSASSRAEEEPQIHQTPTLSLSNVVMPRQIGPFIAGTNANNNSMFSPVSLANQMTPRSRAADTHHDMRQVVNSMQVHGGRDQQTMFMAQEMFQQQKQQPKQLQPHQQSEPLDFSKKSSEASVKSEPSWPDTNSESDSLTEMPISLMVSQANSQIAAAMKQSQEMNDNLDTSTLRCGKCNYVARTLTDYSSHMALHLNKRAFKCAECGAHFTGIDELNKHFMDCHSEKIQEHKEAIQKIPHGLQQTYHLLKMPLDSISGLSSQELMSNEPKQLKCSMCSFVAKWPAELQKHAVSHSEERPFVCMVCGSTYKWKWDLVKHFEKSHSTLPNPYKRREGGGVMACNSPATPPPDIMALAKSQATLMDISAMASGYNDEDIPSGKKRRLSESENSDAEHYWREYFESQARARREMGQMELPPHLIMQARGASSDPVKRVKVENHDSEDYENQTPKRNVHEALKERLNSGKTHEEVTPNKDKSDKKDAKGEVVLPYKCTVCEYRARWPSEISQHMKNHSNEKPYHCPRCSYKSKWKWDVVKHLRRCGGGTVHDVIDTTKMKKMAPPNVMVLPMGHSGQQNGSQSISKTSTNQSVFPGGQHSSSHSPAMSLPMSTVSKSLANNFSLLSENQDHQETMATSNDSSAKQPVFRSLVNQGLHHCLECQFVGNSPTELKRHTLLHSENKPFSCNDCGYSTRWKCDLKKHIKNYGHTNTSITLDSGDDENDSSMEQYTELSEDSDEDQSTLYMCPQCPYNSYKKKAYDLHLKIHGGWSNTGDEASAKSSPQKESSAKYKCSKCDFHGNDLSSFLHHKRSHNAEETSNGRSQDSPVPSDVSNRTLHLKHRRKPVKQFKCDRCPYVCFKKSALDVHDAMHIPRGTDTFLCMFCDYNVFSKTLLLQHMRLHPDYNPAECSEADGKITSVELEEIERLEEAEINSDDSRSMEENNNEGSCESTDRVLDFSRPNSSRTTTPVNAASEHSNKQQASPTNNNSIISNMNNNEKTSPSSGMNLPCEWCSATFPNVVALYHHSQSLHPNQLKAQEAGDIAARQAPSKGSQLEQIVRERQKEYQVFHQVTTQQPSIVLPFQHAPSASSAQSLLNKLVPLAPKPSSSLSPGQLTSPQQDMSSDQLRARKSITQQKKLRSFQCTKCTFTAPNAVTYLRHIERHGSNCKHTCLFCDYSIDRLNLLYQHMKGTHGAQWAGSTEDKISHLVPGEDSNNNLIDEMNGMEDQADDVVGENPEMDVDGNDAEQGVLFDYQEKGIVPKLVKQEETVWHGIPLHICNLEGKRFFKCPKCMYINANAANTANHYQQHGQNRRFRCHQCDYSVDNPKTMQHHLESIHPKDPSYMLVKSLRKSEASAATKHDKDPPTLHLCPKCPYKTTEKMKLAIHLERHSGTGRFECQLCDYKVDQYGHLRHHAKLHKKSVPSLESTDDAMFTTERSFEDQEFAKRWNDNNPIDQTNRSDSRVCFKCGQCPFFTFKKEQILKHRLRHISKGPYACQDCSFSTNFTNDLEEHVQYHSSLQAPNDQALEFVLDPFSELYKVLEKFPDDLEADNGMDNLEDDDMMDVDNDMEDDVEAALMEEELRDTVGGALDMDMRDRNGEAGFDNEIQFRNYKCQECPYSSNSNAEYSKHLKLHGCEKKFKCDFCSYSLDRVNLISQHRKLHFQEKSFESAPLISTLLNKNHEEYESLLAKIGHEIAHPPAENGSKVSDEFLDMYLSHKPGDDKGRYVCNKCPYRCQALKSFRCHIQMHGINRKYRCDYCDWCADRLNLLIQHRRVHSGEKGFNPAPGEIVFLNREFVLDGDSNDVTVGMALVDYQDSPVSAYDPKTSPKKNALGQKIYYCKMCPFKSENLNTFSFHKKLHCIQAKYSCSECSYSINNMTSLQEHIKLHKKEREQILASLAEGGTKHKCPKCPYTCTNKNMLVNHMSMHGAGRKHECNDCDFSTDTQALLTLHHKVHKDGYAESDTIEEMELLMKRSPDVIGPQLYMSTSNSLDLDSDVSDNSDCDLKCEKCPYSTPSKEELGSHNLHHDTKDKHKCMYCTFSCFNEDELVQHVQVHFPSTTVDKEMLRSLKRQSHKRNISKALNDAVKDGNQSTSKDGEPDSTTVTDAAKNDAEVVEKTQNSEKDTKQVEKTKVYVCQYCEREYDDKSSMIQHEKQHLVGSKF